MENIIILISGNPVDGLLFFGPFDDANVAGDWANEQRDIDEWWTAEVERPDDVA